MNFQTKIKKVPWFSGSPLTFSWDLDTLPLLSRSRAVKPYQMDLSSSDRRSMSTAESGFFLYVSSSSFLCCWHRPLGDRLTPTLCCCCQTGMGLHQAASSDTCRTSKVIDWEKGSSSGDRQEIRSFKNFLPQYKTLHYK